MSSLSCPLSSPFLCSSFSFLFFCPSSSLLPLTFFWSLLLFSTLLVLISSAQTCLGLWTSWLEWVENPSCDLTAASKLCKSLSFLRLWWETGRLGERINGVSEGGLVAILHPNRPFILPCAHFSISAFPPPLSPPWLALSDWWIQVWHGLVHPRALARTLVRFSQMLGGGRQEK